MKIAGPLGPAALLGVGKCMTLGRQLSVDPEIVSQLEAVCLMQSLQLGNKFFLKGHVGGALLCLQYRDLYFILAYINYPYKLMWVAKDNSGYLNLNLFTFQITI